MKSVTFALVVATSAFVMGCGSGSSVPPSQAGGESVKDFPKMGQAMSKSPEWKLMNLNTPQEKVEYLRSLAKDSTFDPKQHVTMLEQYSKDSDADVAAAAKDLLDRAK